MILALPYWKSLKALAFQTSLSPNVSAYLNQLQQQTTLTLLCNAIKQSSLWVKNLLVSKVLHQAWLQKCGISSHSWCQTIWVCTQYKEQIYRMSLSFSLSKKLNNIAGWLNPSGDSVAKYCSSSRKLFWKTTISVWGYKWQLICFFSMKTSLKSISKLHLSFSRYLLFCL